MLSLKNISWSSPDGKSVLRNLNLTIPDGKLIVITGPNGGGKTTLARIIAGIEHPMSGQIVLDGEDITELDVTERARRGVSFAFQQPVRFKGITVRHLIETAAGGSLDDGKLCNILGNVGLCAKDYLDREVNATLSGGEIKRIEIATVLARHTKLSLFDEPEAGIDLWSFKNLIQVFQKMHEDLRGNLIIISHQERILRIADEIILLADGTVRTSGTKEEMMQQVLSKENITAACRKQEELFHE
ncbi:MAG: ATP-binding cassette domain-containing protein [Oscillospiraceae bacterium]|nr:ATP-binding cassette domain-containing protein [Oscillospiraceae bacterium]MDY3064368.1 ATP-binding cassette domain-containing protein [Oscillospiraceae bacterium]